MEAITERVRESSSSRRTRPKQTRKSLAESPPSLPRDSQKKRKRRKQTSSAEYYSVKKILEEKTEHGEISYLIDWDDHPETGESYTPTWEPYDNVNRQAINEWNTRSTQGEGRREELQSLQENIQQPASSFDPDSQPIRAAKRQRINRSPSSRSSSQPPTKKPRRAGTIETARFQSVSQETVDSREKPREIKDSYEEEQSLSSESERIRVEIPLDETFDRDAYSKVTVTSSQPTQATQPSQPSQPSGPSYTPSQSQLKTPTPRPFIWDEEEGDRKDDTVPIIPDSQDLPRSSSYKPSHTSASKTGVTTRPNTGTNTKEGIASRHSLPRSLAVSIGSADLGYRHSEPPSYPSRASNLDEFEATSSRVDGSAPRPSIRGQHLSRPTERSEDSYISQVSRSPGPVGHPIHSTSSRSRPGTPNSAFSTDLPISSENDLPSQARGRWLQEATHTLSQVQLHQSWHSVSNESSLQFQTQIPPQKQDENISKIACHHVTQGSHEEVSNQQSIRSEEIQSQTLAPESLLPRSLAPTKGSVSNFEASWQAAQVISTSPQLYTQLDQTSLEQDQRGSLRQTQDARPSLSATPALNNLDVNTQKSPLKSQDRISSEQESGSQPKVQDRLLEQSLGNVLPSIERTLDTISSPTPSRPSPLSSGIVKVSRSYDPFLFPSSRNAGMTDQATGEMSTAEKLRRARTAAAENKMAEQRAARTASAIPHTPPPLVNQMLPLRETAPEPPAALPESAPSPKASPEGEVPATSLQMLPLGDNVFTVPLPMVSLARDIYHQEITNYRPQRQSFLNDDEIDTTLVEDIDTMIERLKMICDHQDLIDTDSATQQMEPDYRQARWAENISTKCIFLAEFFDSLRSIDTHIVLLVRPGRMMDILEALFRTNSYRYSRPDRPSNQAGQGLLRISLLPTDVSQRNVSVEPASLVIAFDSTFVKEQYVESLRADPMNVNRLVPRVHLVITHSIEHLELCIRKTMDQLDRKAILVNSLSQTRGEIGKLDSDYLSPDAAAKAVADFVVDGAMGEWPLLEMPGIEGIEPIPDTAAEEDSNEAQFSGSTTQSYDMSSSAALQSAFKRPLLDDDDSESSKRQRLTPVGGVSSSDINVSRIDEPILDTASKQSVDAKEELEIATADALDAAQDDQLSSLLKKITDLENKLRTKDATEVELRQTNQRLEARCQDYEESIAKIQPKYQEALNERGQAHHDIREFRARETNMRQKLDASTAELAKVREEKALVDAELVTARTALSTSSIPEAAELQKLKDELSTAKIETEKANKKIANAAHEMEYVRGNYQKASSAAAEMCNELNELKVLNATLTRKASDSAVEIHRIQASSEIKQHLQRISGLEGEKAECERELEKKTEELRTLLNGRRTTRGTSVPRSPRMGTMSPGQNSRPMARVLSGVGSRGNSPAPSGGEGVFRGPGTFGDALFAPMGGVNRWGHHLS